MNSNHKQTGFAVALAWPQTYCKQPGSWYDPFTLWLGANHNNYYKVGHAALVLIPAHSPKALYFDFGRYHAPYKHGRVRSVETDHELEVTTTPKIAPDQDSIENLGEILHELQCNPACHGEGELLAAYCPVNYEKALAKVLEMQKCSPIPYGPFKRNGSNCSRFVNTAILAGKPDWKFRMGLKFKVPLTPTPINNVNALRNKIILPKFLTGEPFCPLNRLERHILLSTLPAPEKHPNIPEYAQWLGGEGAGSWFVFEVNGHLLKATRYSPLGIVECAGLYENKNAVHHLKGSPPFTVTYPSNCKMVSVHVNGTELRFHRAS